MKRKFLIFLLTVLSVLCLSGIAACSLFGGGGGGTAPTFKRMTVYSAFGSDSETFAYAEQYESVLITIELDNPDDLIITSVTISGKKYEVSSFESGSSREWIQVKVYVYDAEGVVAYTLESIEYADGKALKYVTPTDKNVVYTGVYIEGQVAAFVTKEIGFTEITLNVTLKDDNGLIAYSNGSVKATLSCNGETVEEIDIVVGNNTVTFAGLTMGERYNYSIWGYYNDLKSGFRDVLLDGETFITNAAVKFGEFTATYDGVEFDLNWHEDAKNYSIKELHILEGDKNTKLDGTATIVSGLLSGRDYTLVIYYDFLGSTYQISRDFHTIEKHAPTLRVSNLWVTEDLIRTDVSIVDNDYTGTLVAKLDGQKVTVGNSKQISFGNLTYGRTYQIEITYNYDLNDGEGEHPLGESYTVTVDSQTIHQTSCKLSYRALDYTTCRVYNNTKCTHEVLGIPSTIDGYTVTKVDRFTSNYLTTLILPDTVTEFALSAFANCKNLTSVTLPQNITALSEKMFSGCEALSDVSIPTSVTTIGDEAFYDCKALTSIAIPTGVETIGKKAFRGTGLQTLTFADNGNLTTIGDEAFYNLNQITELTLPDGIVTIGKEAFDGLNQLTALTIPASVEIVDDSAFSSCNALQNLTFEADSQLRTIGNSAFWNCEKIKELRLPSALKKIGDSAFSGIDVDTLTIPSSVVTIGENAFAASRVGRGVQELIFETDSMLTTIGAGAFSNRALKAVTIPRSVTTVGAQAFFSCKSLTNITFEKNGKLQTIGSRAFAECIGVRYITIPASVTSIGESAFEQSGLTAVIFESGSKLTSIGSNAFKKCSFTSITIPASVTYIGSYAFDSCTVLRTIAFEADCKLQTIGSGAFVGCQSLSTVSIPAGVTTIGEKAFQDSGLRTVNYAENGSLKTIGAYAFAECELSSVIIPSSVVTIGEGAFQNCSGVTTITFAEDCLLQTIGAHAFEGVAITEVVIPHNVTAIGEGAFNNCSTLNTFTAEEGCLLQTIGANFFDGCAALTEVVIPANVITIGKNAFKNLVNLRSVQFEEGSLLQTIGESAFEGCRSLPNIILPRGLVELKRDAFYHCNSLEWVILPTTITFIGASAVERGSHTAIYYMGSYEGWSDVTFESGSDMNYYQIQYKYVYFFVYRPGYPSWHYDWNGNPATSA